MDNRYAQKIIDIAYDECGKVGDDVPHNEPLRRGWERLKEYFDATGRFSRIWDSKGKYKDRTGALKEITNLDGVKLKGMRVPQRNENRTTGEVTWSGTHWCGIFATWCWIQAGVPGVVWGFPGVNGKNVRLVPDTKNYKNKDLTLKDIGIGDIAVMKDKDPNRRLVHHCVVTQLSGEFFSCVNGNSDNQGILFKGPLPLKDISYFYTYREDFYERLSSMYS